MKYFNLLLTVFFFAAVYLRSSDVNPLLYFTKSTPSFLLTEPEQQLIDDDS